MELEVALVVTLLLRLGLRSVVHGAAAAMRLDFLLLVRPDLLLILHGCCLPSLLEIFCFDP
jgi:hypothetical protein